MKRALVVALLLVTACGVPTDPAPRALDPEAAPFGVLGEPTTAPEGEGRVALYFVRGDRVVLQPRPVERSTSIRQLLDLLLEGPTPEQVAAGTRSAIPTDLRIEGVDVSGRGVAVVTLAVGDSQLGTSPLGFAQIVATLTAPGRARSVRFRLDGEDLPVPRGDGSLTSDPLDRSDYADLLLLQTASPAAPSPAAVSPAPG
ncbi:MAG: hypothetical protein EPN99_04695 [Frankiales bacterium]|nr:MAG: hypothetical protein EPN99_04695 [Frankiales bacterium]